MVIMGVSGFEPSGVSGSDRLPIQFFPLGLIGHDPSAALLVDGRLVACAAEERFTRIKHGYNLAGRPVLPRRAMSYCLKEAGLEWRDVDYWAHYCHFTPDNVGERLARVTRRLSKVLKAAVAEEYQDMLENRVGRGVVRRQLEAIAETPISEDRFIAVPHHLAHAAGAYYSSGFEESAWLVLDGYGETESATWGVGAREGICPATSIPLPSSLGVLYQIVSAYLGFRAFGDEYKVMGLSAYGDPYPYSAVFRELVRLGPAGTFSTEGLAQDSLDEWLSDRIGDIPDKGAYSEKAADVAAALQRRVEEAGMHVVACVRDQFRLGTLCLSGGVALNACVNGAIVRSGLIDRLFVQPAAADDGASLGAALYAIQQSNQSAIRVPNTTHWGPSFGDAAISGALGRRPGLRWERAADVAHTAATLLAEGKILGWFQGRMEIGPRALGARSILADPRSVSARDEINARVKGREPFRPFAPSVLDAMASEFFDLPDRTAAPFMVVTYQTHEPVRDKIPAVVHVDGSARVQTVSEVDSPRFHELLRAFHALTGIPVLLNTSFNRAGEPIVCTPDDAIACFMQSGIDALVIGDYVAYPGDGAPDGSRSCEAR
jgi:carbamoyltransferase